MNARARVCTIPHKNSTFVSNDTPNGTFDFLSSMIMDTDLY